MFHVRTWSLRLGWERWEGAILSKLIQLIPSIYSSLRVSSISPACLSLISNCLCFQDHQRKKGLRWKNDNLILPWFRKGDKEAFSIFLRNISLHWLTCVFMVLWVRFCKEEISTTTHIIQSRKKDANTHRWMQNRV